MTKEWVEGIDTSYQLGSYRDYDQTLRTSAGVNGFDKWSCVVLLEDGRGNLLH